LVPKYTHVAGYPSKTDRREFVKQGDHYLPHLGRVPIGHHILNQYEGRHAVQEQVHWPSICRAAAGSEGADNGEQFTLDDTPGRRDGTSPSPCHLAPDENCPGYPCPFGSL